MIIDRKTYIEKLQRSKGNGLIKIITGLRRSGKYIGALYKYYYQDIGLRNAILSFRQNEPTRLMENVIYNEMRQRGWLVDVGNIYHRIRNAEGQQQRVILEVVLYATKAVNGFISSRLGVCRTRRRWNRKNVRCDWWEILSESS